MQLREGWKWQVWGERRGAHSVLMGESEEKKQLEDLNVDGK
jgi:hypothetical protein